jgi:hypothetical protein
MKTATAALCLVLFGGGFASAADNADTVFQSFLTPDSAQCVSLADVAKVGKVVDLSPDQFQFVRALYVAIPPFSRKFPPGDRAVVVGASDGTAMLALVDEGKACARFLAPDFVLKMLRDIPAFFIDFLGWRPSDIVGGPGGDTIA